MNPNLEALLQAVRRGDREAFERAMGPLRECLLGIVESGMDRRLRSVLEPEDVVQDVLLLAYRGMSDLHFPNPAALRGWIETIARHRLIDLARRHFTTRIRRVPEVSLDETRPGTGRDGLRLAEAIPASTASPSSIASRHEMAEALDRALARLPAHYREVLRRSFVDRLPLSEIALGMGRSTDAARKLLARALEACRVELEAGEGRP